MIKQSGTCTCIYIVVDNWAAILRDSRHVENSKLRYKKHKKQFY